MSFFKDVTTAVRVNESISSFGGGGVGAAFCYTNLDLSGLGLFCSLKENSSISKLKTLQITIDH